MMYPILVIMIKCMTIVQRRAKTNAPLSTHAVDFLCHKCYAAIIVQLRGVKRNSEVITNEQLSVTSQHVPAAYTQMIMHLLQLPKMFSRSQKLTNKTTMFEIKKANRN